MESVADASKTILIVGWQEDKRKVDYGAGARNEACKFFKKKLLGRKTEEGKNIFADQN